MREIALDTETTGLLYKEGDRIVEIGCVEIIDKKITGKEFHVYINPERELSVASENITGLNYEFLKQYKTFEFVADDFLNFIKNDRLIIHNAPFDTGFLNFELEKIGKSAMQNEIIDTLVMTKQKFPGSPATLDALCKRFSIDKTLRTKHGALIDSFLLAEVYVIMSVEITQKNIFSSATQQNEKFSLSNKNFNLSSRSFKINESEMQKHWDFINEKIPNSIWRDFE